MFSMSILGYFHPNLSEQSLSAKYSNDFFCESSASFSRTGRLSIRPLLTRNEPSPEELSSFGSCPAQ
jgi:hypothetical protein